MTLFGVAFVTYFSRNCEGIVLRQERNVRRNVNVNVVDTIHVVDEHDLGSRKEQSIPTQNETPTFSPALEIPKHSASRPLSAIDAPPPIINLEQYSNMTASGDGNSVEADGQLSTTQLPSPTLPPQFFVSLEESGLEDVERPPSAIDAPPLIPNLDEFAIKVAATDGTDLDAGGPSPSPTFSSQLIMEMDNVARPLSAIDAPPLNATLAEFLLEKLLSETTNLDADEPNPSPTFPPQLVIPNGSVPRPPSAFDVPPINPSGEEFASPAPVDVTGPNVDGPMSNPTSPPQLDIPKGGMPRPPSEIDNPPRNPNLDMDEPIPSPTLPPQLAIPDESMPRPPSATDVPLINPSGGEFGSLVPVDVTEPEVGGPMSIPTLPPLLDIPGGGMPWPPSAIDVTTRNPNGEEFASPVPVDATEPEVGGPIPNPTFPPQLGVPENGMPTPPSVIDTPLNPNLDMDGLIPNFSFPPQLSVLPWPSVPDTPNSPPVPAGFPPSGDANSFPTLIPDGGTLPSLMLQFPTTPPFVDNPASSQPNQMPIIEPIPTVNSFASATPDAAPQVSPPELLFSTSPTSGTPLEATPLPSDDSAILPTPAVLLTARPSQNEFSNKSPTPFPEISPSPVTFVPEDVPTELPVESPILTSIIPTSDSMPIEPPSILSPSGSATSSRPTTSTASAATTEPLPQASRSPVSTPEGTLMPSAKIESPTASMAPVDGSKSSSDRPSEGITTMITATPSATMTDDTDNDARNPTAAPFESNDPNTLKLSSMPSNVPSDVPSDQPRDMPSTISVPSDLNTDTPDATPSPSQGMDDTSSEMSQETSSPFENPNGTPSSSIGAADLTRPPTLRPNRSINPTIRSDSPVASVSVMPSTIRITEAPASGIDAPSNVAIPSNVPRNVPTGSPSTTASLLTPSTVSESTPTSPSGSALPSDSPSTGASPSLVSMNMTDVTQSPVNSMGQTSSDSPSANANVTPSTSISSTDLTRPPSLRPILSGSPTLRSGAPFANTITEAPVGASGQTRAPDSAKTPTGINAPSGMAIPSSAPMIVTSGSPSPSASSSPQNESIMDESDAPSRIRGPTTSPPSGSAQPSNTPSTSVGPSLVSKNVEVVTMSPVSSVSQTSSDSPSTNGTPSSTITAADLTPSPTLRPGLSSSPTLRSGSPLASPNARPSTNTITKAPVEASDNTRAPNSAKTPTGIKTPSSMAIPSNVPMIVTSGSPSSSVGSSPQNESLVDESDAPSRIRGPTTTPPSGSAQPSASPSPSAGPSLVNTDITGVMQSPVSSMSQTPSNSPSANATPSSSMSVPNRTRSPTLRPIPTNNPTIRSLSPFVDQSALPSTNTITQAPSEAGVNAMPSGSSIPSHLPSNLPTSSIGPSVVISDLQGTSESRMPNTNRPTSGMRFNGAAEQASSNFTYQQPPLDSIMNVMTVRVDLVGGRGFDGIQNADISIVDDVPDIYCSFSVGSQVWVTSTLRNTLKPRWDEFSYFVVSPEDNELLLEVYDDHLDLGEPDLLLGWTKIVVGNSILGIGPIELELNDLLGNGTGAFVELRLDEL